jgi:medium-chain acyl-[acyl-carrier-protein] hydrolase
MNCSTKVMKEPGFLYGFNLKPLATFRLLCFPYAGGDAVTIFRRWSELLPKTVEVCAVQLPGRGARIAEQPISNIHSAAAALCDNLLPYLNTPFAFFGHSMGAKICFEVARLLKTRHGLEPFHLSVSGSPGPRVLNTNPQTYDLPEAQFIEELRKLNGTPPEVLRNAELMKLMLPLLRAEFEANHRYVYVNSPPLECPISVFGGLGDKITRDELRAWHEESTQVCSLHIMPGDHFFINTQASMLLQILYPNLIKSFSNQSLTPCLEARERILNTAPPETR